MVRLFVFLAAAQLVLLVLALISCLAADRVRTMPRALWVLVILLLPILGPLAYFVWGRPARSPDGGTPRRPARPSSPDDDPDFLRSMNTERSRRDRELLDQWEREFNQPKPDSSPPTPPDTSPRASSPDKPQPPTPEPHASEPHTPDPHTPDPRASDPHAAEETVHDREGRKERDGEEHGPRPPASGV